MQYPNYDMRYTWTFSENPYFCIKNFKFLNVDWSLLSQWNENNPSEFSTHRSICNAIVSGGESEKPVLSAPTVSNK